MIVLFLCREGHSLLIAIVQVISSTSRSRKWWFAVFWMVIEGAVAA
jgi:hypothetical protein